MFTQRLLITAITVLLSIVKGPAWAQVDPQVAERYFDEARTLCERDGGRMWGVSLCGPMIFADASTHTLAGSIQVPGGSWPIALGYAGTALDWGGQRWAVYPWGLVHEADVETRGRTMLHELFHRIQPSLDLMTPGGSNEHLDTLEGRLFLQLEWRALARAIESTGPEQRTAIGDALAFRQARQSAFPDSAENERTDEIREGLAEYTGVVAGSSTSDEATRFALWTLTNPETATISFVRGFSYRSGVAYGILLDKFSPGWTRRLETDDSLPALLADAAGIQPTSDTDAAAGRYDGSALRRAEGDREARRQARVADLRRTFIESPVLTLPRPRSVTLASTGEMPIPGAGTVIFGVYRATTAWGRLESTNAIFLTADGEVLHLPLPYRREADTLIGEGWMIVIAPGWIVRPGPRTGDEEIAPQG